MFWCLHFFDCLYVWVFVCLGVNMPVCVYDWLFVYMYERFYIWILCMFWYQYAYVFVCVYVCLCVRKHVCNFVLKNGVVMCSLLLIVYVFCINI